MKFKLLATAACMTTAMLVGGVCVVIQQPVLSAVVHAGLPAL